MAEEIPVEIYVCNNTDCKSRGAESTIDALRSEFSADGKQAVKVYTYMCFSACNVGPNVVIPERRCWLSSVTSDDAGAVRKVVEGGSPPEHLRKNNDPELEELIVGIIDAGLLAPEG